MPFITPITAPITAGTNLPYTTDNPETPPQNIPAAIVTTGNVPLDFLNAHALELQAGWTDWMARMSYESDKHIYMMGNTSTKPFNGASVSFVRLAMPTLLLVCRWTACRLGFEPVLPDPNSLGSQWILLDEHLEPVSITVPPDGSTPLYRINGVYVYGCRNPNSKTHRDISYPRPPWLKDVFERKISDSLLLKGLINTGSANSASPPFLNPIQKG